MGRELTTPSERLKAAAQLAAALIFDGEKMPFSAIDVGCDHAKLAIYLVQSGICAKVLACDINEGPLDKARENVSRRRFKERALSDYIELLLNDGLTGLSEIKAERIFILGMGGELISDIIERSGFVKDKNRKTALILQPMTSEYDLRKYLYTNGFKIIKEQLVKDKGRVYTLILCVFDGVEREYDDVCLTVGEFNILNQSELFSEYLDRKIRIQEKLVCQLEKTGADISNEKELLEKLKALK